MRKLQQLEALINSLIGKGIDFVLGLLKQVLNAISGILGSYVKKFAPKKKEGPKSAFGPITLIKSLIRKIKDAFINIKLFFLKIIEKIKAKILSIKGKVLALANQAKNIDVAKLREKIKSISVKGLIEKGKEKSGVYWVKLKNYPKTIAPQSYVLGSIGLVLVSISLFFIIGQIKEIERISNPEDHQALIKQLEKSMTTSKRPDYYKAYDRQFIIYNVVLPVYVHKKSAIRSLIIDFSVTASNRYICEYFKINEHLIKDHINRVMEPMIPEFPLEKEGKQIIKKKLVKEINILLTKKGIKGNIQNIMFHSIIAG